MPMREILLSSAIILCLLSHLYPIHSEDGGPGHIALRDGGWIKGQIAESSSRGIVIRYHSARIPRQWIERIAKVTPIPHVLSPGNKIYSVVKLRDGLKIYGTVEVLPTIVLIRDSDYFDGERSIARTNIVSIKPLEQGRIFCRNNLVLTGYVKSQSANFIELAYGQSTLNIPRHLVWSREGQLSYSVREQSGFTSLVDRFGTIGVETGLSAYRVYGPLSPSIDRGFSGRVTVWLPLDSASGWFFGFSSGHFRVQGDDSSVLGYPILGTLSLTKPFAYGWGWTVTLGAGPGLETIQSGKLIARQWAVMAFGQVALTWLVSDRLSVSVGVESFHDYDPGGTLNNIGPVLNTGFRL